MSTSDYTPIPGFENVRHKQCNRKDGCLNPLGFWLPATPEFFTRDKKKLDGLNGSCKVCRRHVRREWNKNNPESKRRSAKLDRQRHPERIRNSIHRWIAENREHVDTMRREDYMKNRDRNIAYSVQWQRDNPERFRAIQHARRARENGAEGSFTEDDLLRLYDEQEGRCAYCGISIYWTVYRDVQVDHIHPLSLGGTNNPDNIALCCASCNTSKRDRTLDQWMNTRGW